MSHGSPPTTGPEIGVISDCLCQFPASKGSRKRWTGPEKDAISYLSSGKIQERNQGFKNYKKAALIRALIESPLNSDYTGLSVVKMILQFGTKSDFAFFLCLTRDPRTPSLKFRRAEPKFGLHFRFRESLSPFCPPVLCCQCATEPTVVHRPITASTTMQQSLSQ